MMDSERFNELADHFLNETLDDTTGRELADAIESSPDLREQLRVQISMHGLLARRFRSRNGNVGRRVRAALRDPSQKKGAITRIMERIPAKRPKVEAPEPPRKTVAARFGRRSFIMIAASAAAILAIALTLHFYPKRNAAGGDDDGWAIPEGTSSVATATPEKGIAQVARKGKTLMLTKKRPLIAGDEIATAGADAVALEYPDKTRVEIPSDSRVALQPDALKDEAGIGIALAQGAIAAEVSPQPNGKPMIVSTPQGKAAIVGTRFEISASATQSRLEVQEGKVRFSSALKPESVLVQRGEFAVLARDMKLEAIPSVRDPALWPFSAKSPWNHPLGASAKFVQIDSPRFDPSKGAELVLDANAIPIIIGSASDPERTIFRTTPTKGKTLHIPLDAKPEPSANKLINVVDEKHFLVYEMQGFEPLPDGTIKLSHNSYFNSIQHMGVYSDNKSHGTRTYGGSSMGGIVRKGELATGIRHALGVGVTTAALNAVGPTGKPYVWPACNVAANWEQTYGKTGNLHMGSLLAIPPEVDLAKIGIGDSGPALEFARALQDYGAYIIESADESEQDLKFYFDPAAKSEVPKALQAQLMKVIKYLKVVTNNSPENTGGGGSPRRAPAPPFMKEYTVTATDPN